jgi:very-short-patch-repair endonuclease
MKPKSHGQRPGRGDLEVEWGIDHVGDGEHPRARRDGLARDVDHAMGWPDREIGRLAAGQQALITRAQLIGLGVGRGAIQHALSRGRLHLMHRGVYALVASTALPPLAAERAAVLACGDSAVLGCHSAAAVWTIRPFLAGDVEVLVVGKETGRRRPGICVHRVADLHLRDILSHDGIPITSPARAILDISPQLSERSLERAFDEALVRKIMTIGAVNAVLARYPHARGAGRIRALARPDRKTTATRSKGEEQFLTMVRKARLPDPEVNVRLGRFVADFLWRRERIVLEVDGYDYHRGRGAFERDHERDAEHQHSDFLVIRATWRQLEETPEAVLVWVATALARRRGT